MSELKIRVWDNLFKEFKALDNYFCKAKDGILTVCTNNDDIALDLPTGLKDKNGKEIYEGDIVKYILGNKSIRFDVGRYWLGETLDDLFVANLRYDIEVIGNIHENKELLEEE